jgi:collagen type VI alpha
MSTTTGGAVGPVSQTIPIAEASCPMIADVVLILDESTSIVIGERGNDNWNIYILGFAEHVVQAFTISPSMTRVGVLKFSVGTTVAFYLNRYTDMASLTGAIRQLEINGGETNIAAALRQTRSQMFSEVNGARSGVRHIAILITDGEANRERDLTIEANLTKAAGIEIFTIGITQRINVQELESVASAPLEKHYFFVDEYRNIESILTDLIGKTCSEISDVATNMSQITRSVL